MRGKKLELLTTPNKTLLQVELERDSIAEARQLYDRLRDDELEIVLKKYRRRRSLDANAYAWVLCEKIAVAVYITKIEVYREAIRAVGVYKDFPPLDEATAATLETAWGKVGIGFLTERGYAPDGEKIIVRCYYGSSTYNTRQMWRLIQWLITEATQLGLETKTPAELALLMEDWDGQKRL